MIRLFLALFLAANGAAIAQDTTPDAPATPVVTAELSADTIVVGQPLVLRVTVLVPTWLPTPPDFPSLDVPNVIVRLPERASGPVSENINGETWSGVSRAYRLYPIVPGNVTIPAQRISVTYADPETTQPISTELDVAALSFTATIPPDAEGLDPMILASGFTLEQNVEGDAETLGQGDAVVRSVTANIAGTSPLFIPPLIDDVVPGVVQAYAKEPMLAETEERGVLSGSRTDTVTYVARYGGTVELPDINIDWFNVEKGVVETATVPGMTLTIDAPAEPVGSKLSSRQIAVLVVGAGLFLLLAWLLRRYVLPPLRDLAQRRKADWQESEKFAAKQVDRAIVQKDLTGLLNALAIWSIRCPGTQSARLEQSLALLGEQRFGRSGSKENDWSGVAEAFQIERSFRTRVRADHQSALPPLNPS